MSGVNKVILIGNLGKDPEIRYSEGGIPRLNFSLATSEFYKDKSGNRSEHVEWHNIVMWRTLAENGEKLLKKGMQVYIEGRLQTRQWNDKENIKRSVTEVVADHFVILQRRDQPTQGSSGGTETEQGEGSGSENLQY
ncbi:MAG: single-stranded DNA-binding protein [Bacteroidia bacterium]|jgi:single-strand DNA-binding protein|nr:single-stranded DNA-binding protein [Bacteroidia bacterium]